MYTLITSLFILLAAQTISADYLKPGDLCVGFAGPSKIPCQPGNLCCLVSFDYSICYDGKFCPPHFLDENELCSGIAGPSPYPCRPPLQCCNLSPDNSVCLEQCPSSTS